MTTTTPTSRGGDQRAVLSIAAIIVTVGVTLWLGDLSDTVPTLRNAYGRLHGIGFVLLTMLVSATLAGAVLHSFRARSTGRSVRLGWCNAALVLAYAAVVGLLAWYIGPEVPSDFGSGRGGGAKGSYVAWLIAVVPAFVVVAWVGGLFPRVVPAAPAPEQEAGDGEAGPPAPDPEAAGGADPARPDRPRRFYQVVTVTAGIAWVLGALPFLLLVLLELA